MFDLKNESNWCKAMERAVRLGVAHGQMGFRKMPSKWVWERIGSDFGPTCGCMGHMNYLGRAYSAAYEGVKLSKRVLGAE